jgi:hypothetical protein
MNMGGDPMTKGKPRKVTAADVTLADAPVAVAALGLDVPYYQVRLVGNRLEFHLYGGDVVYWPDAPDTAGPPEEK